MLQRLRCGLVQVRFHAYVSHIFSQKPVGIADSNIANLGSQLEKDVKKAAAMSDPEWREAAQAEPEVGLKIWRIEASVASCAYFVFPSCFCLSVVWGLM